METIYVVTNIVVIHLTRWNESVRQLNIVVRRHYADFIRECKCSLMGFVVVFGRREGACDPIEINKRERGSG